MTTVTCDNYRGGRAIVRHLIATGRRRIGFIGGLADTSTHLERARGFRDALAEAGLAVHAEAEGRFSYEGGQAATQKLMVPATPPDALFCCNDIMALAAIDAARERGMSIPGDLAIAGFDDIPMSGWAPYRLTTLRQPVERMIEEALGLIRAVESGKSIEGTIRIIPGELVRRESA